jgi:putative FmdB family regulatory protein
MPTYDYRCNNCGHEMELFQSISESAKRKCPACSRLKLRRLIGTGAGIIFKGSGFYQTDYRSKSWRSGAESEKKAREAAKSSGDDKKSAKKSSESSSGKKKSKTSS